MKLALFLVLFACVSANAGVVSGAASDVKVAAKVASFPFRHPVVTERGVEKGLIAIGHSLKVALKTAAKV